MGKIKNKIGFSQLAEKEFTKIEKGLKMISRKLIAEEKSRNGYLVISDKKGNIKKVRAKDL